MTRRPPKRLWLPAVLVLSAGFACLLHAFSPFDPREDPHAYFASAAACPKCHPVAGGKPDPDRLLPKSDDFCLGCHSASRPERTHPIGVRPPGKYRHMKVPRDLRLDEDGRLTCLTCHAAHRLFVSRRPAFPTQKPQNPEAATDEPKYYKTFYLRRSDPRIGFAALCAACHEDL